MLTLTVAGLMRNLAPAFIVFLASSIFNTVPTCKVRGDFHKSMRNNNNIHIDEREMLDALTIALF